MIWKCFLKMHKYLTKFHFYTTLDFEETIESIFSHM